MSYVDDLVAAYKRFVALPWETGLAPPQRVWMAIYPPDQERRIRVHVEAFELATKEADHGWGQVDITEAFEHWLAAHPYRDAYFESPELLAPGLSAFHDALVADVRTQLGQHPGPADVVCLIGAGSLFGLGGSIKVSALLNDINDAVAGRLLVLFPGEHEGSSYRLLDARDGWNYLATPITPSRNDR